MRKQLEKYLHLNNEEDIEWCSVCTEESKIIASRTRIQTCENCGAILYPCNFCDIQDSEEVNCGDCPMAKLWGLTNKEVSRQNDRILKRLEKKGYFEGYI